ncbi:hypothetical protein TTHERM_00128870 (macronuclear) [Tetrahymena thermophila SB210]|uniref:Uncharacterized protein n=1 Tax=Tetrahymena thermophila (strain SB210) TaxID=312017 RepID=I7LUV5_TETTS|nr:hypothetical protein TTHERM_00128870 [Tetrahymena thermophila SB210]EAR96123.2 hypothetical protein TTHERM_00128870 [Tetrahymena thermophila SB210]|eukprot:XP_001016368.2 hypothetical protein TTHERM_00128870 [Tetrahymena thermophila SB210]
MIKCSYHDQNEGNYVCFSALCKDRFKTLCLQCIGQDMHKIHQYCQLKELFEKINAQKILKKMKNEEILQEITNAGNNICDRIQEEINKLLELKQQLQKSIQLIVSHFTVHLDLDTGMEHDDPASKCTNNEEVETYLQSIIDFQSYSLDFQIDSKQNFLGVQLNSIKNLFSSERFQFYKYPLENLKERISEVRKYCNQINQSQSEFEISLRKKSAAAKCSSSTCINSKDASNCNGHKSHEKSQNNSGKKLNQLNSTDQNLYNNKTRKMSMLLKDSLFKNGHLQNSTCKEAILKVYDNLNFQVLLEDFMKELESNSLEQVKLLVFQDKQTISSQDINKILKKIQLRSQNLIAFKLQANTKVLKMFDNEKISNWLNKNYQKTLQAFDLSLVFTKVNEYENYLNILQQLNLQNLQEIHLNYILSSIPKYESLFQKHHNLTNINLDILYSLPSQVEEFFEAFFYNQIKSLKITSLYLNFNIKNGQKGIEYLSSFSLDCSFLQYLSHFLSLQKDTLKVFQISENVRFNSSLPLESSVFVDQLNIPQLKSLRVSFNLIGEEDAKSLLQQIEKNFPQIQECHLFQEFDQLFQSSISKKMLSYQKNKMIQVLAILKWKLIHYPTEIIIDILNIVYNQQKIFELDNNLNQVGVISGKQQNTNYASQNE